MFNKLARYYKGRVYVKAQGEGLANFINEALKDGIIFYNGRKREDYFLAEINTRDFSRLRKSAKEAKIKVNMRAKYGFPFVFLRWQKRKGLIIGAFIVFFALIVLSQYVISISVEGNHRVPKNQIIAEAEEIGLKKWMLISRLDLDQLSKQLQANDQDLVWVTIEKRGTNVNIVVVEKTLPQKVIYQGDLIAAKTGVVEDVIVIQGQALVQEGQLVRAGQVLIKAAGGMTEYSYDMSEKSGAKQKSVDAPAAKGFVRGRVWYSVDKEIALVEDVTEKTGKIANGWGIKIGDRVIMITNQDSPFLEFNNETQSYALPVWRNWRFPVEIIKEQYIETKQVQIQRTVQEARKLAEVQARKALMEQMPEGIEVIQDKVRIFSSAQGVEHIRVEGETFEELAVYRQ